jgi:dipeptidyl aminopeptidase/acylaminoacyl peptidase
MCRKGHIVQLFNLRVTCCRLVAWFVLVPLLGSAAPSPTPPPRIPLKDFFDNPKYLSAEISPDGKRLAFLAPVGDRLNIWICKADAPLDTAVAITHEKVRGIYGFNWSRDGRWILYSHDSNGDENYHLFRADPDQPAAAAADLTPTAGSRADFIDLRIETPGQLVAAWHQRDHHYFDAYRIDIVTGTAAMVAQNPGDVDSWSTDTHGRVLAATAVLKDTDSEIRVRPDESGSFKALATYTYDENATIRDFSRDGSFIYLTSAHGSNTSRLVKLDLKTGKETVVDQDPDFDIGGPIISEWTHKLLGVVYNKDRLSYKAFDPEFRKDLERLAAVHDGDILLGNSTRDERKWIITYNSPTDPASTYLYDRDTGKARFIFRPRPWLKPDTLAPVKPVTFKSRDGLTLHGYLTLPKGVAPHDLPAVEIVHGGPWLRAGWGYDGEAQFLANRGYAIISINYRGSDGYGKAFMNAGDKEWGGKMTDDMVDATNWLIGQGIADPKRFAIYGGSYGGYATLAALAFRPGVYACGIDYVGVSNLLTFMNTMPAYWEDSRNIMYKRVGNPNTEQDFLRSRSPVYHADKIVAPLFIAQGYNDPRVNHAEAEQIVAALKKNGKPVEYMVKMDEGHGFRNPENRLDFYSKMESFLAEYLGAGASR